MTSDLRDSLDLPICELARLYALEVLDGQDLIDFEGHLLEDCQGCRKEMEDAQKVTAALALAATPEAPSARLRSRLLVCAGSGLSAGSEVTDTFQPEPDEEAAGSDEPFGTYAVHSSEIPWQPFMVAGAKARTLHTDQMAREIVYLICTDAGVRYPPHRHAGVEEIFMLEGDLIIDGETYGPGDYIRATAGSAHGPNESCHGCLFLLRVSLDNEVFSEEQEWERLIG